MEPVLQVGSPGQFDVLVDGEVIASRDGSFLARLFGGGWPDPTAVARLVGVVLSRPVSSSEPEIERGRQNPART